MKSLRVEVYMSGLFVMAFFIVSFVVFFTTNIGYAAQSAVTQDGKRVILNDDGTWKYEKEYTSSFPEKAERLAIHFVKLEREKISNMPCKDYRVSYSKEAKLSNSDRANNVSKKWCSLLQYICMSGDKWTDHENVLLIEQATNSGYTVPKILNPYLDSISQICGVYYEQMKDR